MLKRIGLLSAFVLSLAVGAIPAGAQSGPIAYYTIYFGESGIVGRLNPHCFNGNITYTLTGIQTDTSQVIEGYICGPNGPEPLE